MEKNFIVYIVVASVVFAAVGVGAGYLAFNEEDDRETYWFYLENTQTADADGWYSVEAESAQDAFCLIASQEEFNIDASFGSFGFSLNSFDGLAMENTTDGWVWWVLYIWDDEGDDWIESPTGLSGVTANTIAYVYGNTSLTPSGWENKGPFA